MADTSTPRPVLELIVIDCPDPRGLAAFYGEILGWDVENADDDFVTISPPHPGASIGFQHVPDYATPTWPGGEHPQQMHLDLYVPDIGVAEPSVVSAGARVHEHQPSTNGGFRVYVDPAGHPFCLISPK